LFFHAVACRHLIELYFPALIIVELLKRGESDYRHANRFINSSDTSSHFHLLTAFPLRFVPQYFDYLKEMKIVFIAIFYELFPCAICLLLDRYRALVYRDFAIFSSERS